MRHSPSGNTILRSVGDREMSVGDLAHQLLAVSDYEKSVAIASDLMKAIRDLIDERREPA